MLLLLCENGCCLISTPEEGEVLRARGWGRHGERRREGAARGVVGRRGAVETLAGVANECPG